MEQNLAKGLLVKKNILLYLIPHFYGKQNETTRKVGDFITEMIKIVVDSIQFH